MFVSGYDGALVSCVPASKLPSPQSFTVGTLVVCNGIKINVVIIPGLVSISRQDTLVFASLYPRTTSRFPPILLHLVVYSSTTSFTR